MLLTLHSHLLLPSQHYLYLLQAQNSPLSLNHHFIVFCYMVLYLLTRKILCLIALLLIIQLLVSFLTLITSQGVDTCNLLDTLLIPPFLVCSINLPFSYSLPPPCINSHLLSIITLIYSISRPSLSHCPIEIKISLLSTLSFLLLTS